MWHIQYNNIIHSLKDEILIYATTWVNLKNVNSKLNKPDTKDKYSMIPFI